MEKSKLVKMYTDEEKSISDISKITGKGLSTVRYWLHKYNLIRTRAEGVRLASHKIGINSKGKKRVFTEEWKNNMRIAAISRHSKTLTGVTLKPSGYYEITVGFNKYRSLHVVIMEYYLGRPITDNEVVHHINGIKTDNRLENLQLMSKSEHCSHHANENYIKRERNSKGQFN